MSLQTIPIVLSSINTTVFRNWINAISTALTALGVTKTADTGQVNLAPATLALPTAAQGLSQGGATFNAYEIRQMVSAGKPTIYLKIRYGVNWNQTGVGANFYWPAISIEWGVSTDGAGNITPFEAGGLRYIVVSTSGNSGSLSASSGRPSATAQNCYIASDGANYLNIVLGSNAPSFETLCFMVASIERTNTPGAATFTYNGNGVVVLSPLNGIIENTTTASGAVPVAAPGSSGQVTYLLQDFNLGQSFWGSSNIPGQTPSYVYKPNASTDCSVYPITVGVGHGPLLSAVCIDAATMTENTQFATNLYNGTRNFIAVRRTSRAPDPYSITDIALRID